MDFDATSTLLATGEISCTSYLLLVEYTAPSDVHMQAAVTATSRYLTATNTSVLTVSRDVVELSSKRSSHVIPQHSHAVLRLNCIVVHCGIVGCLLYSSTFHEVTVCPQNYYITISI